MITSCQVFLSQSAVPKGYYAWGQFCILGFVSSRLLPEARASASGRAGRALALLLFRPDHFTRGNAHARVCRLVPRLYQ